MTKNEIITGVLKNLRDNSTEEDLQSSTYADDQNDVISYLEAVLHDAEPNANIRTCADFVDLNVQCCDTCHHFGFPYDMSPLAELKAGGHTWTCCSIEGALGEDLIVKHRKSGMPAKAAEYKPFADFFGGSKVNHGN
jgi:hypothetical protein